MLSVVIVLSAVGSVSSSTMVADDGWMLAGRLSADAPGDAGGEATNTVARQFDLPPGEFRSVLRSVRRLDPAPAPRPTLPTVDQTVLAARPLPVAADLPLSAPHPVAIWPSARFSTPSASIPPARSLTPSGRPQLSLACQAPRAADLGQQVRYRLVVRNTGDGVARQVVVEPHLVAGADSRSRVPRWFPVGDLAPGASREIILRTVARQAESLQVRFFASDLHGSEAEAGVQVEVRRPAVEIAVAGPDAITLGDEAIFEIRAGNAGAAAAEPVSVACSAGDGLRLTVVDQQVQFTAKAGQLVWALGRLAAGETKVLRFQARPLIAGEQRIRVAVENAAASEKTITVRDRTVDQRTAGL
jgi:uncharacterized repeat protein (TIGR01451 family)